MQDYQILIRECESRINITDWCCRIIVEARNSWLTTQLATPINGRKPVYHQANTSTTTKNQCEQGKKNEHQRKHRKRPKKSSICKAQKLLSHLFLCMHKTSSLWCSFKQRKQESADISSYDFFQALSAVSLKTLHNRDRTLREWHTASRCWKPEP